MPNLEEFRNKIDTVDDKILELLNERMTYVKSIGELKQSSGGTIYRPERERAIINRLKNANLGLLDQNAIEAIYQEIFAVSRNLEMPQTIAYLGPEGTYTHQAARSRFGAMSRYIALANIEDVFKELSNKEAKYGVVPIENNTEGAVGITLDCLGKYNELKIFGEIYMDIHHSFVGINENLKEIKQSTGFGLNYFSLNELEQIFKVYFNEVKITQELIKLSFDNALDVFRHLKLSGVNSLGFYPLNKGFLKEFEEKFQNKLTYHPVFILCKNDIK